MLAGARVEVADYKKIQEILFFGNHQPKKNLAGKVLGAMADPVGILNVLQWLKLILGKRLIFMAEGKT